VLYVVAPRLRAADGDRCDVALRAEHRPVAEADMPRFFFHFHDGVCEDSDREGLVLPNQALAEAEGRRAVSMLVTDDHGAFDWSRWLLTVMNENGACVLRLPFQSVLDELRGARRQMH
jgi:fermentation-respiration switch protein FrsA (DUF1100 family)